MPLRGRRPRLEAFARRFFSAAASIRLSPATLKLTQARKWFRTVGGNLDGVMAKLLDSPYRPGERTAMQKVKLVRSADCVVGGFRYLASEKLVGSFTALATLLMPEARTRGGETVRVESDTGEVPEDQCR